MESAAPSAVFSTAVDSAREVLRMAMDYRIGAIPPRDESLLLDEDVFALSKEAFWFESPGGVRFHYRLGGQVVAQYDDPALEDEFRLYLHGTAYGAVAWLNDLLPLHASAVETGGRAIAFTGPSGSGKSTLAAALCRRGFRLFSDDTLVLVPTEAGPIALPDGKPLKLWEDALGILGATGSAPIASVPGKYYVRTAGANPEPAGLTDLIFLERGDECRLGPITGRAKFEKLLGAFYRAFVHVARGDRDLHTRLLVEVASKVRFWTLERPANVSEFESETAEIEQLIRSELSF